MRSILLAAALAALSTPAFAGDELMASFFGNTAVATGGLADTHTYYNADHSFTMTAPAFNKEWKGTWKLDGNTLCRTYETAPPGVSNPLCTPIEQHKVGDTWSLTMDGKTRTVTLVKGIQ